MEERNFKHEIINVSGSSMMGFFFLKFIFLNRLRFGERNEGNLNHERIYLSYKTNIR